MPHAGLISILTTAVFAQIAEIEPAKTQWTVDHGDALCTLSRSVEPAEGKLSLSGLPGGDFTSLQVDGLRDARGGPFAPMTLLLDGQPFEAKFQPWHEGHIVSFQTRGEVERLGRASTVALRNMHGEVVQLLLPGLGRAFAAWRECEAQRLRDWGVDPDQHRALARRPRTEKPFASYMQGIEYPDSAARLGIQGTTVVRVAVREDGRVRNCAAVVSSGAKELDDLVCAFLVRRARYIPGEAADGSPRAGWHFVRNHWRLRD